MADGIARETPYKRFYHSRAGNLLRERPGAVALEQATVAAAIYQGALHGHKFQAIVKRGVLPATGVGLAWLGASMVHDGIVYDTQHRPTKAGGKIMLGTGLATGGVALIGKGFGISALSNGPRNWSIMGASAIVSGGLMAYDALKNDAKSQKVVAAGTAVGVKGISAVTERVIALGARIMPAAQAQK